MTAAELDIEERVDQVLAMMVVRGEDRFVREIGRNLQDAVDGHRLWTRDCAQQHMHDDLPCDEFGRALYLGLSWLLGYASRLHRDLE